MKSNFIASSVYDLKIGMHDSLNQFSKEHPNVGRLLSLPVALIDTTLDVGSLPFTIIENLALIAINLVGAAFSSKCSTKDALGHGVILLLNAGLLLVSPILALFILVVQTGKILSSPETARPLGEEDYLKQKAAMA